jgi:hypothetical protein
MNCIRPGTAKKIRDRLRRHAALMAQYEAEGMTREEASKRAFAEVTKRK